MPWLTILGRFWYVLVIAGLVLATYDQTVRLNAAKAEYAAFQTSVKAVGDAQLAKNKEKEAEYAKNLQTAVDSRADALRRLRVASSSSSTPTTNPAAPIGSSQVCTDSATFTAAFQRFGESLDRFIQDTRGYSVEGDSAQIDAQTLLQSWPK